MLSKPIKQDNEIWVDTRGDSNSTVLYTLCSVGVVGVGYDESDHWVRYRSHVTYYDGLVESKGVLRLRGADLKGQEFRPNESNMSRQFCFSLQ